MEILLDRLLENRECEWLDFKQEHHKNKAELIHDILCLANSEAKESRYLVFGVDNDRNVIGVNDDTSRRKQADLYDLIDKSNFNIVPAIRLYTVKQLDKEVDILEIEHRRERPYFLLKDKIFQGITVRAGVAYSRLADRNTPIDSCVDDKKLERMILERFRLDQTPSERLREYVLDMDRWQREDSFSAYYVPFPEFTFAEVDRQGDLDSYDEPWVRTFPDPKGYRYEVQSKYYETVLESFSIISCDGGRYYTVQPHLKYAENKQYYFYFYYHLKNTHSYNLNLFFSRKTWDHRGYNGPCAVLESADEVEACLEAARTDGRYFHGMYLLDKTTRKYYGQGPSGQLFELRAATHS